LQNPDELSDGSDWLTTALVHNGLTIGRLTAMREECLDVMASAPAACKETQAYARLVVLCGHLATSLKCAAGEDLLNLNPRAS